MADDDPTDLNPLSPAGVLHVNASPLQRPGQDTLLRTAVVGGPDAGGDRRVYLSATLLGKLLEVARSSAMGRVVVGHAGLRVDLYRRDDGHEYEVWSLVGDQPVPERVPDFVRYASADWREG
jgi:hypothetical protein